MPEVLWFHWVAFGLFVAVLLALDLLVFHRKDHDPSLRESTFWSAFWIALAFAFNGFVWWWLGHDAALAFLQGYVVEKTLSMDNIFVFAVVFSYFHVPLKYQYRVLFWGILGAVFMRLVFVAGATSLIHHFDWALWIFGAFLVYTAVKLAFHSDENVHPENNPIMKLARRHFPVTAGDTGNRFFLRVDGKLHITPLFLVLIVIETTDVVFAVDSVPAIIGVVNTFMEPGSAFTFIAFSSNVFAILGLRALYFLLAGMIDRFQYLSYGLAAVLGFVGVKMVADYWIPRFPDLFGIEHPEDFHLVDGVQSMAIIFGILVVSVLASLTMSRRQLKEPPETPEEQQQP